MGQEVVEFRGGKTAWCTKCNKPVESYELATPIEAIPPAGPNDPDWSQQHTGEMILTVNCHGETFKCSNWWGVLTP